MSLNEQDARALTYLACRIRKETHGAATWDEHGTYAVIAKLVGRNLASTVEQVARHAADPEARTPGAINRPHMPEPKVERFMPPKAAEACRTCGYHLDRCICGERATRPREVTEASRKAQAKAHEAMLDAVRGQR